MVSKREKIQEVVPRLKLHMRGMLEPETWRGKRRFILYSLLLHLAFFTLFAISFDWRSKPEPSSKEVDIVKATAVDESAVLAEIEKLRRADAKRKSDEAARQKRLEQQASKAREQRRREEQRLKELEKQKQAQQQRARELEKQKQQEAERLQKIKAEHEALEKKRQQEQQRLKELEQKRQQEQEKLKRQEEEQRRLEEERMRKELLAEEERRIKAARERAASAEMNRYVEIIKQKVTRNWLRPSGSSSGLSCEVLVNLIPGGEVVAARIVTSSGDPLFDQSVERAVLKASPLPLPPDPAMFERFRELRFVFSPEE